MKINFISTGDKFPYTYYLGVLTALRRLEGEVVLHILKEPTSEYFELLKKEKKLTIRKIEMDMNFPVLKMEFYTPTTTKRMQENWQKVLMFDYLMWKTVSEEGGVIMGLDSISLENWFNLIGDKEMLVPLVGDKENYKMHGVIVKKDSELAKKIFKDILQVMNGKDIKGKYRAIIDGKYRWGGAGIISYINNILENKDKVNIVNIYDKTFPLSGSSSKFFDEINEEYIAVNNDKISKSVKTVLTENEWNPFKKKIAKKKNFRFHLLSLVHLPQSKKYMSCAFTQKNRKLAKMLTSLGHEVFFYGSEGSDVEEYCNSDKLHFIQTHTLKDIIDDYGDGDNRYEINYNWTNTDFRHDFSSERKPSTKKFYNKCISEIIKVKKPDDFLLLSQGNYYESIKQAVGLYLNCEFGIGYRGSVKTNFRAFESSYIQNYTYGAENGLAVCANGSYYDRVIPNYFDPEDFTYSDKKKDYYLFIGRLIRRKGILTAYETTKAIGAKLIIVGQGGFVDKRGYLIDDAPHEFEIPNDSDWEYVGFADVNKRKELMANAIATFTPTIYLECFAGTHIESMLSGTPPITTNFGVFPETIPDYLNGKIGFKCNTLQDFVDAAKKARNVDHKFIRKYGERFLMDNVKLEYQKWFEDLYQVYKSTDGKTPGWHFLSNS